MDWYILIYTHCKSIHFRILLLCTINWPACVMQMCGNLISQFGSSDISSSSKLNTTHFGGISSSLRDSPVETSSPKWCPTYLR